MVVNDFMGAKNFGTCPQTEKIFIYLVGGKKKKKHWKGPLKPFFYQII